MELPVVSDINQDILINNILDAVCSRQMMARLECRKVYEGVVTGSFFIPLVIDDDPEDMQNLFHEQDSIIPDDTGVDLWFYITRNFYLI